MGKSIIHRRILGEDHPSTTFAMKNVAHFIFERGKLDEAMAMLEDIMQREERTIGSEHPHYAQSLTLLGAIHANRKQFVEAEATYRRAGDIIFNANGSTPDIGLIYNNLASLYQEQRQIEKAIEYYRKAEAVFRLTEGSDHVDVVMALVNRAVCHGMLADFGSALHCYKVASPIAERVYGRVSNKVAVIKGMSALAENRSGNDDDARELYAEAFGIYREMGFPKTDDCKVILSNYAVWLRDMGDTDRNREIRKILNSFED